MSAFADSSALVKLYADESDEGVREGPPSWVVSALARVEVPAALWRKQHLGELALDDAAVLVASFDADFHGTGSDAPRFVVLALGATVLELAAALLRHHPLRTLDALQLASALAARDVDPACDTIVCWDRTLRAAATREGFALLPV